MKTTPLRPAAALLATLLLVCACGGDDDDDNAAAAAAAPPADTIPPAPSALQGLWTGATASGRTLSGVVLSDGTYYLRYTAPGAPALVAGALQGKARAGATRWWSPDAKDFGLEGSGVQSVAVEGSFTARAAFGGIITFASGAATSFQAVYDATYSLPASLDTVAGSYTGSALWLLGVQPSTLTISRSGALTGMVAGCTISGAVQPRLDGNAYSLSATLGPVPCGNPGQTYIGVAYLDASMRRLHVVAPNLSRTEGLLFEGLKPVP
jgi:hypothetical protein